MKIAFRPQRRVERVEVRDLTGGSPHATWTVDDVRDIPDDDYTMVRDPSGEIVRRKTIDAIFSAGPDFVDADTGINPRFASARSGQHTVDEGFFNLQTLAFVAYQDADGNRLTVEEFLEDHPEHIAHHERAGLSRDILDRVKDHAKEHAAKHPASAEVDSDAALARASAPAFEVPNSFASDTARTGQGE